MTGLSAIKNSKKNLLGFTQSLEQEEKPQAVGYAGVATSKTTQSFIKQTNLQAAFLILFTPTSWVMPPMA